MCISIDRYACIALAEPGEIDLERTHRFRILEISRDMISDYDEVILELHEKDSGIATRGLSAQQVRRSLPASERNYFETNPSERSRDITPCLR